MVSILGNNNHGKRQTLSRVPLNGCGCKEKRILLKQGGISAIRTGMLRAVIFDFNGIIVNDEPIHFRLFQRVLGEEGIPLTEEDYYARYLGFDDRGAFIAGYHDHHRELSDAKLTELIERKAVYYQEAIRNHVEIFPGVKSLVASLADSLPLAVASGALRQEIETILSTIGLLT